MNDALRSRSIRDYRYWLAFEERLATKPLTSGNPGARADLVRVAYVDVTHRDVGPEDAAIHADHAYRLRYELGPTIARATLAEVRADQAKERRRLLNEGVSPALLGLLD